MEILLKLYWKVTGDMFVSLIAQIYKILFKIGALIVISNTTFCYHFFIYITTKDYKKRLQIMCHLNL